MTEKTMDTKINKITMQGFKSFKKKVSVPLLDGFNIFCGPNGVGKSNVIDAVCFVLGRRSAKSMRAGRLHELIFHGGDGKSASKRASVTMYLDNSDRVFNFDDDEITVTRKVNKKGTSVYKMNGRTTTREKILESLSSARIYPDGHNIVMQGDITHIIEMSPEERRGMIDEISGIADYEDKKKRAEKDMEAVNKKLREAEILISERYDRFKRLEQERDSAIRYRKLQKKVTLLRASLAHKKSEDLRRDIKEIEEEIKQKTVLEEKIKKRIDELETELDERDEKMRDIADKLIDMSKKVDEEKKISELRSRMLVIQNKIDSNIREIQNLDSLIDKLEAFESRAQEMSGKLPRTVKTILNLKINGVHGAVRHLIKVPEKYSIAIEVAAGRHLNDIIVENEGVAKHCIDFLKREKVGRATFLPLNKIKPRFFRNNSMLNESGVVGIASKIIKYDTKYMTAIEHVLGGTLIVKDFDTAKKLGIGKQRMVTLDGDIMTHTGEVTGGHFRRTNPKSISKSNEAEIESHIKRRGKLREETKRMKEDLEIIKEELNKMGQSEETKKIIDVQKMKISSEKEMEKLRGKRKTAYKRQVKIQTDLNKLNVQKARAEADLKNAEIDVRQYKKMDYIDEGVKSLQKFLRKTMDELNSIGPVNMKAIEEYDAFRSMFDEYKKKYEKILKEKKAVVDMIEEIEKKRMEVFYRCLKKVSENFSDVFNRMTKGEASLELEDSSNIESGLMIQATPEGKKMLNLDSMSGGEKTLTALAFIFAIQKFKPAPFYILDEVDAALDKENSVKIAELIKSLSKDEQFIMITHNDQTIKYGDRVYGITMESGESKILGVELPE